MKKTSTIFLKIVTVLFGILTLALIVFWFPFSDNYGVGEGLFVNYFQDPAMIGIYIMAVPFFIALYQTFKLLDYIEKDKIFSKVAINSLKNIKYCIFAVIGLIILAEVCLALFITNEDRAGVIALGIYTIFLLSAVSAFVAVLQKLLQRAVDLKSENDLTV